jgi:hypothetical protein
LDPAAVGPLQRDPELGRLLGPALKISPSPWITLDAESAAFERLVASGRGGPGFRYTPELQFDDKEIGSARWLRVRCENVLAETNADHEHNDARRAAAPWLRTGPTQAHRVLRDLSLVRIKLRPLQIGAMEQWIEEWAVPNAVVRLLESDGLTGFSTRPILSARRARHDDFVQLDTTHVMPPVVEDPGILVQSPLSEDPLIDAGTIEDQPPPPGACHYRLLGSLVYPAEAAFPASDFARTAEAFGSWGQALWVVSGRVRDFCKRHSVRGWDFRVALTVGSAIHSESLRLWGALEHKIAANPGNRLW